MDQKLPLDSQIEAILFSRGEPIATKKLTEVLEKSHAEIEDGLGILRQKMEGRGIKLITLNDKVMLGTDPNFSSLISKINKEEMEKELGKASLETLSVIFYKGPISKKEIEYIRGVNSSYILRNLAIRGLIEKTNDENSRSGLYKITFDLLTNLGLKNIDELPEYKEMRMEIDKLKLRQEEEKSDEKRI
ncbi:MAG: SMC-Scp complex subunit ScpB [Patescibacteria group bacterium]